MSKDMPEFEIFCAALCQYPKEREPLTQKLQNCDWSKILEGAKRHRVERQLLAGLYRSGPLPPAFEVELRTLAREAAHSSLMQMRETVRLATLFQQENLPAIVLKGVALSIQTGREPSDRNSRDIDFFIARDRLTPADGVMRAAGYRIQGPDLHDRATNYLRWNKEVKYFHPEHGTLVELHYRLVDNEVLLNCGFDELWQGHETVAIGGGEVAVMGRRQLAIYLCIHGATHVWERLCWLMDLAAALPSRESVTEAIEQASARGLAAPMLHAVLVAHKWLGLDVTAEQLAVAKKCRRVARLNAILARSYSSQNWYRSPSRGSLEGFLRYSLSVRCFVFLLKPGWQYRKALLARELIAPADWDTFALPRSLGWAYPLFRPFGWIVRRLTRSA
jgi:hypothetical protein